MNLLPEALRYAERGWAVFPLTGKVPRTPRGVLDATTNAVTISEWWERWPDAGIGLACGGASGVWVLDLDGQEAADRFVALQVEHGDIPKTAAVRTGRGWHLYFASPSTGEEIRNSASRVAPGIDVRGTGGYVVLPPSLHPSGIRYEWLPGRGPDAVRGAPFWLVRLTGKKPSERTGDVHTLPRIPMGGGMRARYVMRAIESECVELAKTPEGARNDRLNLAAFAVARFVASGDFDRIGAMKMLTLAARYCGLSEQEAEATILSAFKARGVR